MSCSPPARGTPPGVLNQHSGKCLDVVSGASTADVATVQHYTCNGRTNHMVNLQPVSAVGNSKDYQLAAVHNGMCGSQIHQWNCARRAHPTTRGTRSGACDACAD
ncbi:RICIN domain-containing protein [Streptomyces venezuelae]|uniref:RICIN domain-containing protein n=1 Tax=Streptomyces venezuelae TaxID=54571 RepID=UPI0037D02CB8